jgi:hypothetical protein
MKGPLSDKEGNELHSMTNLVEFEYDPLTSRRNKRTGSVSAEYSQRT